MNAEPADARVANWGLHPIDRHLVMGDLLDLVAKQSRSWLGRRTAR